MFAKEDLGPTWTTLEEWEANKSTKWEVALRILKRCMATDDDEMLPRWEERDNLCGGELVIPDEDSFEDDPDAKAKTVIYVEFTKPLTWFVPVSQVIYFLDKKLILSSCWRCMGSIRCWSRAMRLRWSA